MHGIYEFSGQHAFLSNFYPVPHFGRGTNGINKTVEHYFQASKCRYEEDAVLVVRAPTAGSAKRLGRKFAKRLDWEQPSGFERFTVREKIMLDFTRDKYQDIPLAQKLLGTDGCLLVEGNWWHDNDWGNCRCPRCKDIPGMNMLGHILMRVRSELEQTLPRWFT
jgi:ribA/ribD-fused uncharacterized protein